MRRVVLAGCGHSHLEVVRGAASFAVRGVELALIDPGLFWYSGRGSGLLGGRFTEDEATIDPRRLAEACGARFLRDCVVGLDRASREVVMRSGDRLGYDLVSFNIGSQVREPGGAGEAATSAKPIGSIPALQRALVETRGYVRVVVVGGGATGCEIAGNLLHLRQAASLDMSVALVGAEAELMPHAPKGARRRALRSLSGRGALVILSDAADIVEDGMLRLASGNAIGFDRLVLATGLDADPLVATLNLPVRDAGLRVNATLCSIGDARVFAAGDCAAIEGFDLPKIGVYGVRAGPVLLGNLLATLDGREPEVFRPQKRFLSVLDLADGEGLAMRGGLWMGGRSALVLKNQLDQRFLDRYRRLYGAA